jgi:hypothetical protein
MVVSSCVDYQYRATSHRPLSLVMMDRMVLVAAGKHGELCAALSLAAINVSQGHG